MEQFEKKPKSLEDLSEEEREEYRHSIEILKEKPHLNKLVDEKIIEDAKRAQKENQN